MGATAIDRVGVRVAGPNVVLTVNRGTVQPGSFAMLAANGQTITSESLPIGAGILAPDPSGSQWAWSVDDTPASAPSGTSHHGHIVVAGQNAPQRVVSSWVAPPGFVDILTDWTDMGIILERPDQGGCGIGYHNDDATFLVDPATGAISQLFANGQHYGDARRGVVAGFASSRSAILINGTIYDEPGTVANKLFVSADGSEVGVERYHVSSCGDESNISTELIDVGTHASQDITGCGISGWFDQSNFVCHGLGDTKQKVESLQGQTVASLGDGEFEGVLPGS